VIRSLVVLAAAVPAACTVAPIDPVPAAVRAATDGDLLRALAYLDQIPAMHPRHEEAVAFSRSIEARIVGSQRWFATSVRATAAGRSAEAAAAWQRSRELWPRAPFLEPGWDQGLAAVAEGAGATSPRSATVEGPGPEAVATTSFTKEPALADPYPESPPPTPMDTSVPAVLGDHPADSAAPVLFGPFPTGAPADETDSSVPVEPARAVAFPLAESPGSNGLPKADLANLRAAVRGRDKARAIAQLTSAHASYPENLEVRAMLADLLRQRALIAYGRGWLEAALDDWTTVADLMPEDRHALTHMEVARRELSRRRAHESRRKNAGG